MDSISKRLLAWYDRHARTLPWRTSPADGKRGVVPDPYHVWLSEVMLQQTTVTTVKPYFEKFVTMWPGVTDLARADTEDVMKAWAGLGYYSRARNLKACADIVASTMDGRFPKTQAELRTLPGIGDYTSAAIAAIAFGEVAAVVDGNVERVVIRHTANATPLPKAKDDCRRFMADVTPSDRPGDFVQAVMDLGATICTPRSPGCVICPLKEDCQARKAGSMLDFPVKAPKKVKSNRVGAAFVALNERGAVWLVKRPDIGLLGGMTAVPSTLWTAARNGATGAESAPFPGRWQSCGSIRHTFTHFHIELEVYKTSNTSPTGAGWWSPPDTLTGEALPTVMKKVITAALPDAFRRHSNDAH